MACTSIQFLFQITTYFVGTNVRTDYDECHTRNIGVVGNSIITTTTGHKNIFSPSNIRQNQVEYKKGYLVESIKEGGGIENVGEYNQQNKQKMYLDDGFNAIEHATDLPTEGKQSVEKFLLR